jgi:hypothetical protein
MKGILAAAAFTALLIGGFAWLCVDGLWRPDGFDYVQIAREIARGHGISSLQAIYVLHLEFLREHAGFAEPWPNLHRFPLPSLAQAALFRGLGAGTPAVVAYGAIFHAATSALLFAWARAALGTGAAAAAVFLFSCNGAMLESACSGLSEPAASFFFTLAAWAGWRARRERAAALWLVAGAALGAATLARTNALLAAPVFVLGLALKGGACEGAARAHLRRALLAGALFLAGLGLVLAPWLLRNQALTGSPFFSLHGYFLLPSGTGPLWEKWDLTVPWVRERVPPLEFALAHPGALLAKWWRHLLALLADLPTFAATVGVLPAALAAALLPLNSQLRTLAALAVGAFALNAALVSFTDFYFDKYSFHFLPLAMLLAVATLVWALDRIASDRARAVALALALAIMADLPGVVGAIERVRAQSARFERDHFERLRDWTEARDVILSDQSYAVAWEADRRSVRLHYDRLADGTPVLAALAISRDYLPLRGVYLSREFVAEPSRRRILENTLERQPAFRRLFPQRHEFDSGGPLRRFPGRGRQRWRTGRTWGRCA